MLKTTDFDQDEVMNRIHSLADMYDKELKKPIGERDMNKVNQLLWARFYQGMKLDCNGIPWC